MELWTPSFSEAQSLKVADFLARHSVEESGSLLSGAFHQRKGFRTTTQHSSALYRNPTAPPQVCNPGRAPVEGVDEDFGIPKIADVGLNNGVEIAMFASIPCRSACASCNDTCSTPQKHMLLASLQTVYEPDHSFSL